MEALTWNLVRVAGIKPREEVVAHFVWGKVEQHSTVPNPDDAREVSESEVHTVKVHQ